jgi:hypothetical protein
MVDTKEHDMTNERNVSDRLDMIESKVDRILETLGKATHREVTEEARGLVNEALSDYANGYSDTFKEHIPGDFVTKAPYTVRT